MPKWWNEQQVCGTYTREANTVGARTGEKGAHVGRARQQGRAQQRGIACGARAAREARTAKGRARQGGAALGGHARPSGAYARAPNGGRGPRHVGGVGAYARAHHWGANGGRARLQRGAYICFALLI
jgi:hypothetical protein